jgi:hypothetical protein
MFMCLWVVEVVRLLAVPPRFRDKGRAGTLLVSSLYIVYLSGKFGVTLEF